MTFREEIQPFGKSGTTLQNHSVTAQNTPMFNSTAEITWQQKYTKRGNKTLEAKCERRNCRNVLTNWTVSKEATI
jgi:hypothetical protein